MSHTYRPAGPCGTCEDHDGSTFQRTAVAPVRSRAELDGGRPSAARPRPAAVRVTPEPPATPRVLGLCGDCRIAATCTLPRPDGGVWHCEEYE